jgi:hypothetical protein
MGNVKCHNLYMRAVLCFVTDFSAENTQKVGTTAAYVLYCNIMYT